MTSIRSEAGARRAARAVLIGLLAAFLVVVLTGSGSETATGRLGGDYPAFYAAGELVSSDVDSLYEPTAQSAAQSELFAGEDPGFLYFAYPPYVAAAYMPLAELDYRLSYVVHTAVMLAALVLGLWLLRPLLGWIDRNFEVAVAGSLLFYPMLRGVTSGQNTALTFLLMVVAFRAWDDRQDWLAGLALAALMYKPQFALPLVGLALLRGRWRSLATWAVGALGLFLVGAAMQGASWVTGWSEQVRWFTELDADVNGANAISWLGFAENLWGVGDSVAALVGWGLALATAGGLAWLWWRRPSLTNPQQLAVVAPALILISPHAMFYDAGLLVLSFGALLSLDWQRWRVWVGGLWAAGFLQIFAADLGWSPLFGVTLVCLGVGVVAVVSDGEPSRRLVGVA